MPTLNLGRVGFVNKGTWLISTAYKINDTVTYLGGTYAALQANTGQTPILGGTIYWQEWVANDVVHKSGAETITDVKTFTSSPIIPAATLSGQAINKGQLDLKAPLASPALTGDVSINGVNIGVYTYRNRFINGAMNVSQVNVDAAVTVTAGAALQYVIDQWYAYCTGANVTGQRIAGSLQSKYRYQYAGAAGVTKIGHAQRMEAKNTYDMNGQSTIVGVDMSNSLLTSVTWTAWYANTADTFGTLASPTRTQIATGTITVSPTLERHFIPISIPSAATTGIEIEFSVGAQTSGTWVIGKAQFEKVPTGATQGTEFEYLPIEEEERRCSEYLPVIEGNYEVGQCIGATTATLVVKLSTPMRIPATGILYTAAVGSFSITNSAGTGIALTALAFAASGKRSLILSAAVASGLTAGNSTFLYTAGNKIFILGAQL